MQFSTRELQILAQVMVQVPMAYKDSAPIVQKIEAELKLRYRAKETAEPQKSQES